MKYWPVYLPQRSWPDWYWPGGIGAPIIVDNIVFVLYIDQAHEFIVYIDQAQSFIVYIDQAQDFELEL